MSELFRIPPASKKSAQLRGIFLATLGAFLIPLAFGEADENPLPEVQMDFTPEAISLHWDTFAGTTYQVQGTETLVDEWQSIGAALIGDGNPATFTEPRAAEVPQKFYRLSVTPETFQPGDLAPAWQLDAQTDFAGTPDGPVSRWTGTGITSALQASATERPILGGGAVTFDGDGDNLSFPMWPGGIGQEWTFAVLMKIRTGIQKDHSLFGCDVTANRALDFAFRDTGIYTFTPGYGPLVRLDEAAASPNDNWRIMVVRSTGATIKVHFDWYEGEIPGDPPNATTGNFNLGCGYWWGTTSTPVTIRYASFIPTCISDENTQRMIRWLEKKKGGEYPPLTLIYAGGQSNYLNSVYTLRRDLPGQLGNVAFSCSRYYGSSPLNLWMNDKADLSGFEVCPFYDLTAAPQNTSAYYIGEAHSGTRILDSWNLRTSNLAKHTKLRKVCLFLQGETDCGDSTRLWWPNGDGQYNLHYSDPYWLADTYGPRSAAWNAAIRQSTGYPDLTFIYERIAFAPSYSLTAQQLEAGHRQRKSQLDVMAADPRYLLVDTAEFPRPDGVHFSVPEYQAAEMPNTGSERFTRAAVRLINASDRLATMSTDARFLAMRIIDSGFILDDEAKFQACETLAAAPDFASLRSLVIPTLTADNAVDQERLRRCNLLLHLGGKYPVSFLPTQPATPIATYTGAPDTQALTTALETFLTACGATGPISLTEAPQ